MQRLLAVVLGCLLLAGPAWANSTPGNLGVATTTLASGKLPFDQGPGTDTALGFDTTPFCVAAGNLTLCAGGVTLAKIASQSANTITGAATAGSPTALSIPSCSTATSALTWTTNTGFGCNTITTTVTITGAPANGNLTKWTGAASISNTDLTGDVTTGGASATTITNAAVTYAKMQNGAGNHLLRANSGAAPSEFSEGSGVFAALGAALNGSSGMVGALTPTNNNCVTGNGSAWTSVACPTGGGTPVIFVGATAGAANTYTIAAPTPGGFTLTDQYEVCGSISATNTGASTLNVNSTGATAIKKQTPAGLVALTGGELVASNTQYCFQYNATGTSFVLQTNLAGGVTQGFTTASVTQAQWANWQVLVITSSSQTVTLPVATSLSGNGGLVIVTTTNTATLAPNAADGINGGTINTPVTLAANTVSIVTTSGASGTGAITATTGVTFGSNVTAALGNTLSSAGGVTSTIASGTSALGTGAIGSGACATVVTTSATNTATTDVVLASFNGDPTAVTGYTPTSNGMLTIISYPTSGNVNFKVCNNTASSITPGAITLNWRVVR